MKLDYSTVLFDGFAPVFNRVKKKTVNLNMY